MTRAFGLARRTLVTREMPLQPTPWRRRIRASAGSARPNASLRQDSRGKPEREEIEGGQIWTNARGQQSITGHGAPW